MINRIYCALCLVALATLLLAMVTVAVMTTWQHAVNWPTAAFVLALALLAVLTWQKEGGR